MSYVNLRVTLQLDLPPRITTPNSGLAIGGVFRIFSAVSPLLYFRCGHRFVAHPSTGADDLRPHGVIASGRIKYARARIRLGGDFGYCYERDRY